MKKITKKVAIPLRGFFFCNHPRWGGAEGAILRGLQSPYGAFSFATVGLNGKIQAGEGGYPLQSPYGAFSFATAG